MPLRPSPSVAWQVIDGQAVLVDLAQGRTVGLNAAGSLIWSALAEQCEERVVAERLCQSFEIDLDSAWRDVREFVHSLQSQGLLVVA